MEILSHGAVEHSAAAYSDAPNPPKIRSRSILADSQDKTSAWSAGIKNALNIRIGHKISSTIPTGEYQSEHAEWWIEQDLPTGATVDDVQDLFEQQLHARREKWKTTVSESARSTSTPTSMSSSSSSPPKTALQSPSTRPPNQSKPQTTSMSVGPRIPEPSKWKTTPKGMEWMFGDDPEAAMLVAAIQGKTGSDSGHRELSVQSIDRERWRPPLRQPLEKV